MSDEWTNWIRDCRDTSYQLKAFFSTKIKYWGKKSHIQCNFLWKRRKYHDTNDDRFKTFRRTCNFYFGHPPDLGNIHRGIWNLRWVWATVTQKFGNNRERISPKMLCYLDVSVLREWHADDAGDINIFWSTFSLLCHHLSLKKLGLVRIICPGRLVRNVGNCEYLWSLASSSSELITSLR